MIKDEQPKPGLVEMGTNFVKAATKHILTGAENVSEEVYKKRLEICNSCEFRKEMHCTKCGCQIARKAKWLSNQCPIGKWTENGA